jgi:hypothetical protein
MKNYIIVGVALATLSLSLMAAPRYAWADDHDDHGDVLLITGTVNANGTSQTTTNAFTIAHPSPGRYIITFDPDVFGKNIPACIVMPLGNFSIAGILENVSFCDFTLINFPSNAPTDTIFNFMAAPITKNLKLPH